MKLPVPANEAIDGLVADAGAEDPAVGRAGAVDVYPHRRPRGRVLPRILPDVLSAGLSRAAERPVALADRAGGLGRVAPTLDQRASHVALLRRDLPVEFLRRA